jgi:phage protein D
MADDVPFATVKFVRINGKGFDLAPTVESVDVEDHDRAIDRARIVFDDRDARIAPILREQLRVQITLGWRSENAFIFEGIVMSHKTEAMGGGQRVTITAYDLSYRMKQRKPETFTFNQGKLSDALKAIAGKYSSEGINVDDKKSIVLDNDPTFTSLLPLTKKESQSDWDFVQELSEKYRARAFVEVNDNKSTFYFVSEKRLLKGDAMGTLHYCPGGGAEKLVEFKYERIGSGASPASTVTVVDPKTGDPVTQKADPPAPEKPLEVDPKADAELAKAADQVANDSSKPEDSRPTPVIPGAPSDPDKAARLIQQDPTRILGFSGTGTAIGTIKLRAKGKVTIKGIAPWAEGDWYVHKVNHLFTRIVVKDKRLKDQDRSTYQTRFSATR